MTSNNTRWALRSCLSIWASLMLLCVAAPATSAEMDAQRIIESLKPEAAPAMRTRSLRNLQVEQTGVSGAASEAPPKCVIDHRLSL